MLRYYCYDPFCDYETEFDNLKDAREFCKLNACKCIDRNTIEVVCDFTEDYDD